MPKQRRFSSNLMKPKRVIQGIFYVVGWTVCQTPTAVHAAESARITQILDGPHVFIQDKRAKVNDVAKKGQRIRTGRARAELRFSSGAVGRLAHNSSLTIGRCARLQNGSMMVNGSMNGCSYSAVAGVRGTTYVLEVDGRGASTLRVLEGQVLVTRSSVPIPDETDVSATNQPRQALSGAAIEQAKIVQTKQVSPDTQSDTQLDTQLDSRIPPVSLQAGEQVTLSPAGYPGQVERIAQPEFSKLVSEDWVQHYEAPLPGAEKIRQSYQSQFPNQPYPKARSCGAGIPAAIRIRYPGDYQLLRSNYCPRNDD
jgi:hypothetical protein